MDETNKGADLSGTVTAEAANEDMGSGVMDQNQFADWLVSKGKPKKAPVETAREAEPAEVTATEDAEEPAEAETAETEAPAEGDAAEGEEQPEAEAETEDEEVLSKSDSNKPDKLAKWQEKTQKRIDELTAKAKSAEEAKQKLEAELAQLKAAPPVEEKTETITVPVSDPNDRTSAVLDPDSLAKLEREARDALDFLDANEAAIYRAIARDEETVKLNDGGEYKLVDLERFKRDSKRHLEKLIPQRREFLKTRNEALAFVKEIRPTVLDKKSEDYQSFNEWRRKQPGVNALPNAELIYSLAMEGLASLEEKKKKAAPPVVKPAATTPPKSGADTTPAAAPAKARGNIGEKAKLKAELDKAEKEYDKSNSQEAYARTLILRSRLKKIS